MTPCQGGWCSSRNKCAHHFAPVMVGRTPPDRLCPKGIEQPQPIRVVFRDKPMEELTT